MEVKVFKKYLFNFIALLVFVGLILLVTVNSWSQAAFGVEGYFELKELPTVVGNGLALPWKNINILVLIVYLVPGIFAIFFILLILLSIIRGKWSPFLYIFWLLILTAIIAGATAIVFSILVSPDSGGIYESRLNHFRDALLFKGITLEGIDFQNKEALITLVKQIGYSIVLWLIALFAVINFFAYLNVGCTYISKANRRKVYYPSQKDFAKTPINYYYVSNYYTQPGATVPYSSKVINTTNPGKKNKDMVYPKIKIKDNAQNN